jgi:hypothetical protein
MVPTTTSLHSVMGCLGTEQWPFWEADTLVSLLSNVRYYCPLDVAPLMHTWKKRRDGGAIHVP